MTNLNGIQIVGVLLAVLGALVALVTGLIPDVTVSGGSTGGSGTVSVAAPTALPWVALGVMALGVCLVYVGRETAEGPREVVVRGDDAGR